MERFEAAKSKNNHVQSVIKEVCSGCIATSGLGRWPSETFFSPPMLSVDQEARR